MNLKHELFVMNYIKSGADLDTTCKDMSVKSSTAKRWLKREDIQNKITELNSDIEQTLKINKTKIVSEYWDISQEAKKDIEKTGTLAVKSLDSISKLMGYDAPVKVEHSMDLSSWLTQLPKEEIIDVETN